MVDFEHISVIVHWALKNLHGPRWTITEEEALQNPEGVSNFGAWYSRTLSHQSIAYVGQVLLDKNADAIRDHYDDDSEYMIFDADHIPEMRWSALEILSALMCYEYQACDAKDYEESEAHRIVNSIKHGIESKLTEGTDVWEITSDTVPASVREQVRF